MHIQLQHSFFSPVRGGQERRMHALAEEYLRLGHRVSVLVSETGAQSLDKFTRLGLHFWVHPDLFGPGWKTVFDPCVYPRRLAEFLAHCGQRSRPDVVLSFNVFCGLASKRAWPKVPMGYLPGSAISDWYSQLQGRRNGWKQPALAMKSYLALHQERKALALADAIFVETQSLKKRLQELHPHVHPRYVLWRTPVDRRCFAPSAIGRKAIRQELGIGGNRIVLLCVGRLQRNKNFGTVIRALSAVRECDFVLLVVGEGPARAALEQLASEGGIGDRVRFLGLRHDVERVYAAADVFLHPALAESYGNVLQEAMASGLACVVSPSQYVGMSADLEDGIQVLFANPLRPPDWTKPIERLLWDRDLVRRLGAAAQRWVEAKPGWPELANVLLQELRPVGADADEASVQRRAVPARQRQGALKNELES